MSTYEVSRINDSTCYVTSKDWLLYLDGHQHATQVGICFRIVDTREYDATASKTFPYMLDAEIIADSPHESFDESYNNLTPLTLIQDCLDYVGGVPILPFLLKCVRNAAEDCSAPNAFATFVNAFTAEEVPANAAEEDLRNLLFRDEAAANKAIDYLLTHRINNLPLWLGFVMDRPVNRMGEDGWSVLEKQVRGVA